ncbi:MAG: hypothetical protein O3A63_08270 [Proteobacteria bacterium]|nr:hypothetical protein [Pseudomonadota bacterium]
MLDAQVAKIAHLQVTDQGHTIDLAIQCHQAVCYWLYCEAFSNPPTGNVFLSGSFANTPSFLTGLAKMGKPVKQEDLRGGRVEKGEVLIFTDNQLEAKHSCITKSGSLIGGYNQLNWFSSPGIASDYTEHAFDDVQWAKSGIVRLNTKKSGGFLVAIPARQALLYFRGNFKPA